jgi:exodeoxyribonuclease VII large subunit
MISYRRELLLRRRHELGSGISGQLKQKQSRLQIIAGRMDALSPLAILQRGYAICRNRAGDIVKNVSQVETGDPLRVKLAAGELQCLVSETIPDE